MVSQINIILQYANNISEVNIHVQTQILSFTGIKGNSVKLHYYCSPVQMVEKTKITQLSINYICGVIKWWEILAI